MRNGNFSCICQIRVFPLWGMSRAKRLLLIKAMLRTCHFCKDVSGEIFILGSLEGALGGDVGARLGPFGAVLMPSKIITVRC